MWQDLYVFNVKIINLIRQHDVTSGSGLVPYRNTLCTLLLFLEAKYASVFIKLLRTVSVNVVYISQLHHSVFDLPLTEFFHHLTFSFLHVS